MVPLSSVHIVRRAALCVFRPLHPASLLLVTGPPRSWGLSCGGTNWEPEDLLWPTLHLTKSLHTQAAQIDLLLENSFLSFEQDLTLLLSCRLPFNMGFLYNHLSQQINWLACWTKNVLDVRSHQTPPCFPCLQTTTWIVMYESMMKQNKSFLVTL